MSSEYFGHLNCEAALEDFLADLKDMLAQQVQTTITLQIPTMQWVDILFDIIEEDKQYQIAKGEEPFLDIVFACEQADDTPIIDAFDGADPMEDLADLMKQLRDALEEGDDDEED